MAPYCMAVMSLDRMDRKDGSNPHKKGDIVLVSTDHRQSEIMACSHIFGGNKLPSAAPSITW